MHTEKVKETEALSLVQGGYWRLIRDYNRFVQEDEISLFSCTYLHD